MKNLNLDSSTNLSGDEESSEGTLTYSESPDSNSKGGTSPPSAAAPPSKMEKKLSASSKEETSSSANSDQQASDKKEVDPEPEKAVVVSRGAALPKVSMDDFKILKVLGKGAYGKVFQVRRAFMNVYIVPENVSGRG